MTRSTIIETMALGGCRVCKHACESCRATAGNYLTALEASGMAVVARAAWPPHVSFDIDGGLGLEWDGPGRSHYLIQVRGDADVVWIVRQDGKLLHGNEHKVGSGDGKAPAPEASAEGEARSTPPSPKE